MKSRKVARIVREQLELALGDRKKRAPRRPKATSAAKATKAFRITDEMLSYSRQRRVTPEDLARANPFKLPQPPPGVIPEGGRTMAMDDAFGSGGALGWASNGFLTGGWGVYGQGYSFQGYQELALLAQIPEYRIPSEVMATEMTREGWELQATGDDDKTDKIDLINTELERLGVKDVFYNYVEQDGFFGRSHLYLDTGDTDNPDELKLPIGDGRDALSKRKIGKERKLLRVGCIEPIWVYPAQYNSINPLKENFYRPDVWYCMGTEIHRTRLLVGVGRKVPDLLKPAFMFGGLSLSQMMKPYVDYWLQNRTAVGQILNAFSVMALATDLSTTTQGDGDQLFKRIALFNNLRNNSGTFLFNKDTEDFKNVSAPLGTIDTLLAQSQEHMAAVSRIPLVKLLGISPHGLNATAEPELRAFYDTVHAYQERFLRAPLRTIVDFVQLSLFGEVDPAITFKFKPLFALNEKDQAEVQKTKAETHDILLNGCQAVSPEDIRKSVAADPESDYPGLDPDEMPDIPEPPEKINLRGTEPFGGENDNAEAAE